MLVTYAYSQNIAEQLPDWQHDHFTVIAGGMPFTEIVVTLYRTAQKTGVRWDHWIVSVKGYNPSTGYTYLGTAYPPMRKDHSKRPGYRYILKQLGIKVIK